jgi:hypothetical protein
MVAGASLDGRAGGRGRKKNPPQNFTEGLDEDKRGHRDCRSRNANDGQTSASSVAQGDHAANNSHIGACPSHNGIIGESAAHPSARAAEPHAVPADGSGDEAQVADRSPGKGQL